MANVLVIGCGNPVRSDDGLGWHAARALARRWGAEARFLADNQVELGEVELMVCQQLTMDLVEKLPGARRVIFIDAAARGTPGVVTREAVAPETPQNLVSHQFDPSTLLAAARALYGQAPEAVVFSVAAQSFDYSEELSPEVAAALPELVRQVLEFIG